MKKFAMKILGGNTIGCVCLLSGIVSAQIVFLVIKIYNSTPSLIASVNALKAGLGPRWAVASILTTRCLPQIFQKILIAAAVFMIKFICGPSPKNKRPHQNMFQVEPVANGDDAIPGNYIFLAGPLTGKPRVKGWGVVSRLPRQDARYSVIRKTASYERNSGALAARDAACNFLGSHRDPFRSLVRSRASVASAVFGFAIMPQAGAGA